MSSAVKRLDARVKLTGLFAVSILVILIDSAVALGAFMCVALLLHILARTEMAKLRVLLVLLAVALWGTTFSQAIFYGGHPRTAILTLIPAHAGILGQLTGGVHIYSEGFSYGMVQGLRFLVMTTLGMLVVWTTEPQDMLSGMLRMRIPYAQAFMLVTAFRFIPILMEEINAILLAMHIKGVGGLGYWTFHPLRMAGCIMNPLLANLVRKSGFLALSVECRGFSPSATRHVSGDGSLTPVETALILGIFLFILSVVTVKLIFLLYFHGLYYASSLRPIYSLARNYL